MIRVGGESTDRETTEVVEPIVEDTAWSGAFKAWREGLDRQGFVQIPPRPLSLTGRPQRNVDQVDVAAGLEKLAALGWDLEKDARTFMVIEYALKRWARGEEAQGERLALGQGETDSGLREAAIDLTSWRVVLATAIAAAEEKEIGDAH